MRMTRTDAAALALLSASTVLATVWFRYLWEEKFWVAVSVSAILLLFAGLLPWRIRLLHAVSIGVCAGAFLGGCLAVETVFGPGANPESQPVPSARQN